MGIFKFIYGIQKYQFKNWQKKFVLSKNLYKKKFQNPRN